MVSFSDSGNGSDISNVPLLDDTPLLELNDDSFLLVPGGMEVYRVLAQTGEADLLFDIFLQTLVFLGHSRCGRRLSHHCCF